MYPEVEGRMDPAPSRLSYRYQRLKLTPAWRVFVRLGLPFAAALFVGGALFSNPEVRLRIGLQMTELRRMIEERPEFQVSMMAVDGASAELSEDIRTILPLDFPMSGFDLDLEAMRRQVAGLDPVASVTMRIREGGVLQVDVVERLPAVVWRGLEGVEILDHEGHRIGALLARAERPDLPLLTGEGANTSVVEALELFEIAAPIAGRIRGLVRVGARRWDLVLDRDQRIMLPEDGAAEALDLLLIADLSDDILARDITRFDLRLGQRLTLRLAPFAREELRRIRAGR